MLNDPTLASLFAHVERTDAGPEAIAGPPYGLPGAPASRPRAAPTLDQHTIEIYAGELGYIPEEVAQLYRLGIICVVDLPIGGDPLRFRHLPAIPEASSRPAGTPQVSRITMRPHRIRSQPRPE